MRRALWYFLSAQKVRTNNPLHFTSFRSSPFEEGQFFLIPLLINLLKLLLFKGTTRVSVVCDDGRFISPKEYSAIEQARTEGFIFSYFEHNILEFPVFFTLAVCCYYHSHCFCYVLLAAKRTKSPGTRDVAVGCCFVRKLPLATFLSHFQPCHESLLVCFLGAAELSRLAALVHLTSVHTVLALFPKSKRPFVVLLTVPDLFINYLCYD